MHVDLQKTSGRSPFTSILVQKLLNKENIVQHFSILQKGRLGLTDDNLENRGNTVSQNLGYYLVQQIAARDRPKMIHLESMLSLGDERDDDMIDLF